MDLRRFYILTILHQRRVLLVEYLVDWDYMEAMKQFEAYCGMACYSKNTIILDSLRESTSWMDGTHMTASTEEVASRKPMK